MSPFAASIIPADWRCWAANQPVVVRALLGGLTNQSYLISADNALLVLRKNSPISEALNLNRNAEAHALDLAEKVGLCAPLVYSDPQQQYMVSAYLGDKTWSVNGDDSLSQLAALLRGIHQLPSIDADLIIDDKIEYYWQGIDASAAFSSELKHLDAAIRAHIISAKSLNSGDVLCHNDLLASNLIIGDDSNLYAIDWEYAAMTDPFYELAVIIEGNSLNFEQQQFLLSTYFERPLTQQDLQQLQHWKIIYRYLSVLWYGVQYSSGAMHHRNMEKEMAHQIQGLKALIAA